MKRDIGELVSYFAEVYGGGLDTERLERALATVLAANACPNEIARRRASLIFARIEREHDVTWADMLSSRKSWRVVEARDRMKWELLEAGVSSEAAGQILECDRTAVVKGAARHEKRRAHSAGIRTHAGARS